MKENRSIFWPLVFIVTGVLWLLINMQIIPATNLWALTHIWPYLLIALGMGLILRSFWRPFGAIVTALVVVGGAAAVFYAAPLGWAEAPRLGVDNNLAGAISGSGVTVKETRKTAGFDSISIRFPAEVTITQGSTSSVTVEAEDNLLPQLATQVQSGTLVIENTEGSWARRVDPTQPVKISIVVSALKEINFSSAGTLTVKNLTMDSLRVNISGAGEVKISGLVATRLEVGLSGAGSVRVDGKADDVSIKISGLGSFDGQYLTSQNAIVEISGAGSASIRVKQKLTAKVSGAGSINYYGNPAVNKHISGAGAVNRAGE